MTKMQKTTKTMTPAEADTYTDAIEDEDAEVEGVSIADYDALAAKAAKWDSYCALADERAAELATDTPQSQQRKLARMIIERPNTISSCDSNDPNARYSLLSTATELAKLILADDTDEG